MNKIQQIDNSTKKVYQTPQLKKVGELKKITLKAGSLSDGMVSRSM